MIEEIEREVYVLKETDLIALIQGKAFHFHVPNKYHIEIRPPNHGIKLTYKDWAKIKSNLYPSLSILDLIEKIEERRKKCLKKPNQQNQNYSRKY